MLRKCILANLTSLCVKHKTSLWRKPLLHIGTADTSLKAKSFQCVFIKVTIKSKNLCIGNDALVFTNTSEDSEAFASEPFSFHMLFPDAVLTKQAGKLLSVDYFLFAKR